MVDEGAASDLAGRLKAHGSTTGCLSGQAALCDVAAHPDAHSVMAAIVGAAGLAPTMAAVRAGKRILLANKEALVMSGAFFMEAVREHGAELLPIDSEHNAIFQCLPATCSASPVSAIWRGGISKILLTGSGGPFRYADVGELHHVTPAQAIAHPNWSMGPRSRWTPPP
jgi:1-deoxy-D-xylulose-5-phosphate reductoisomerase